MKRLALLCALLLLPVLAVPLHAATDDNSASSSDTSDSSSAAAGGVAISPDSGEITPGTVLTVTFPVPMVPPAQIDLGNQQSPIIAHVADSDGLLHQLAQIPLLGHRKDAQPSVTGTFLWKSETEGEFTVSSVIAGSTNHFTLAAGLKDATGKAFSAPEWSADFTAPVFSLSSDTEFRDHLSARPRFPVTSTYPVTLADVATHAWIQDRDSRAHFPVEIIQTSDGPPVATEFQVTPRDSLPPNHTYDLVVEGLPDAASHEPLPYPEVFPLGDTHDLKIEWLGGFDNALDAPTISIKFNDSIPPEALEPGLIQVTPDVPNIHMEANADQIDITGDFDLTQRYHVTIDQSLTGERGYPLPAQSRWAASFPPRQPSISFPGPRVYLRSKSQLHFAFMQSHTPAVTWRLASIPLDKLPAVTARLSEYNETEKDPLTGNNIPDAKTGTDKQKQTELLISAFDLPVLTTGICPASDSPADTLREISAPLPSAAALAGPYLIEASSKLPDGRIAGGRALVFYSDYVLTQKRSPGKVYMRVSKMSDALPAPGVTVRALREDCIEIGRAVTDSNGVAIFSRANLFPQKNPAHYFIADTTGGPSISFADAAGYADSASDNYVSKPAQRRAAIITDRNLYRPGEDVKMKGILRNATAAGVEIPNIGEVRWQITQGENDKVIGQGATILNDDGAFEASWHIPEKVALGQCTLKCTRGGQAYSGSASIDIEEYRVPLFSVETAAPTETGTTAHMQVSSFFFHGGANSGARIHWKALWTASEGAGSYNSYAQIGPVLDDENAPTKTLQGDTKLDAQGHAAIAIDAPFATNPQVGASTIDWTADITSIDGQTLTGGVTQSFSSTPVILDVSASESDTPRGIAVSLKTHDPDNNDLTNPTNVTAEFYHVNTRTVKEQVAPLVFRYRNTDEFTKVDSRDTAAPGDFVFTATTAGRYVVAVRARDVTTPLVSAEATLTAREEDERDATPAQMPVTDDFHFNLTTRKEPWKPGDRAEFTVQAAYKGVAWVCVETDEILDTMLVPLAGNAARIEIPVKKEYAPNATVAVYLTRPGGGADLPVERFATAPLNVRRPDRELFLAPHLDRAEARPGQAIHGEVLATSEGKPVADADLAVFAVDDAVLKLGEWQLPDLLAIFYPLNSHDITSYQSLTNFIDQVDGKAGFQKGFVIGDGSDSSANANSSVRKEFKTLAFWQASVKTGADGKATFSFDAPDNLTAYRLVALGETRDGQFGGDASQTVKINKPLMIDPALPRFLRDRDEVEMRAVVRQSFADSAPVSVSFAAESGSFAGDCVAISGTEQIEAAAVSGTLNAELHPTVGRDTPAIVRFKVHLADTNLDPVKVRFTAVSRIDPTMSDAVEMTIPVSPSTITRRESVAGTITGPAFNPATSMPGDWTRGRGEYSLTLSTSPWLAALEGIPTILDYPHGCFEQISSKLLCYGLLAGLMDYLPGTAARLGDYNILFQQAIRQVDANILPDGRMPLWPGQTTPHDFATCQVCWAMSEAASDGFDIPEGLTDKLAKGVKTIATGSGDLTTRAFALYVIATLKPADDLSATAEDIYLHRNNMDYDGRAFLAMAVHRLNIMPGEKTQLLREIDKTIVPTAFKPQTFGSMERTEGIAAMAFETIQPPNFNAAKKAEILNRLQHVLSSGSALSAENNDLGFFVLRAGAHYLPVHVFSTQENLWLLLAFKSMLEAQPAPPLASARPAATALSKNNASAAWTAQSLANPLALAGLNQTALTFLMQAEYTLPELDTPRVDRGFRVERVVKNLSDSSRTGDPGAPFRIGDSVLITYRIFSERQQYYVALEDSLPAAFETVNPDIAQIGQFFQLPPTAPGDNLLDLSHSELRDRSTLLYFDAMAPGSGVYSVLARVTSAGTFRWPATQVTPMYDSRFSGLSASSVCAVSAEP